MGLFVEIWGLKIFVYFVRAPGIFSIEADRIECHRFGMKDLTFKHRQDEDILVSYPSID